MKRFDRAALWAAALAAMILALPAQSQTTQVYAAWAQIDGSGPSGGAAGYTDLNLTLRVLLDTDPDAACPAFKLSVDQPGQAAAVVSPTWQKRSNNPNTTIFPLIVCQAEMDNAWTAARLLQDAPGEAPVTYDGSAAQPVALAAAASVGGSGPPGFVAFGDTGCRGIGNPRGDQSCDGQAGRYTTSFQFEKVAEMAAAQAPQFVVHLGDYRYDKERKYTHHQSWDMWKSDFFSRVRLGLLGQVPWAFVRGNHEECDLAGQGWFFFFGPRAHKGNCATTTQSSIAEAWWFDVADRSVGLTDPHRFIVLDTSPGVHRGDALWSRSVDQFKTALNAAHTPGWPASAAPSAWLVMHKPVLAADAYDDPPTQDDHFTGQALADAVAALDLPGCAAPYDAAKCGLRAVLAAHLHVLQNVVFKGAALPQQFVVGMSGVRLDHPVTPEGCKIAVNGLGMADGRPYGVIANIRGRARRSTGDRDFGFAHWVRDVSSGQSGWRGTAQFVDGSGFMLADAASLDRIDLEDPGVPACHG